MNDLPLRPAAEIGAVEDRFFTLRNFPLTDGTVMPEATIAYRPMAGSGIVNLSGSGKMPRLVAGSSGSKSTSA